MNLPAEGGVPRRPGSRKVGLAALAPPRFMVRAQFILEQAAFLEPPFLRGHGRASSPRSDAVLPPTHTTLAAAACKL